MTNPSTLKQIIHKHPFILILVIGTALFMGSWHTWTDILSDVGFNAYTAWQLSEGKKLYTELAYQHGPLSQFINGAIFWVSSPYLENLAIANFILLMGICWLILKLFTELFSASTATIVTIFFLCTFGIVQNNPLDGFNYILPYKPEASHGIFLCLLTALSLHHAHKNSNYFYLVGLIGGCITLMSIELITGFYSALFATLILCFKRPPIHKIIALIWVAPAMTFAYFLTYMNAKDAFLYAAHAFVGPMLLPNVTKLPHYQNLMGIDLWQSNIKGILLIGGISFAILAALVALSAKAKLSEQKAKWLGIFLGTLFICVNLYIPLWRKYSINLPIFLTLLMFFFSFRIVTKKTIRSPVLFIGILGFILFLKIFLNPKVNYYGFFLGAPGALLFAAALLEYIPKKMNKFHLHTTLYKNTVVICILGVSALHLQVTFQNYALRSIYFGTPKNEIATYPPHIDHVPKLLESALSWILTFTRPDSTLLMLPEGDIYNFMAKRIRPIPYTLHPIDFLAYGGEIIFEKIRVAKPDYIGFIGRDATSFNLEPFGKSQSYGKEIVDWILQNYSKEIQLGDNPLEPGKMGIVFYRRYDYSK